MLLSTMFGMAALGVGGLIGVSAFFGAFYTVQQESEALITRFGKFSRSGKAGLNFKVPFIEAVAKRVHTGLQEHKDDLDIKTVDDMTVVLPISIQYNVRDTKKYAFDIVGDPSEQIMNLVSEAVSTKTSGMDSQDLYDKRSEINAAVVSKIATSMQDYGIEVKRIVISEPKFPDEVLQAYNDVRASERRLEAGRNQAEEKKVHIVKESEARREAAANSGKGIAEQREAIMSNYADSIEMLKARGISMEAAERMILIAMQFDTMREIGEQGNMIVTTADVQAGIAQMQTLGNTLKAANDADPVVPKRAPAAPAMG